MKRFVLALVPLSLMGCANVHVGGSLGGFVQKSQIAGDGIKKEVKRNVGLYDKVVVGSAFQVQASEGTATPLTISGDSNILNSIKTEVKDKVLFVSVEGNISSKNPLRLNLSTPSIKSLDASGATKVDLRLQSKHDFSLQGSGSSEIKVDGPIGNLACDLSGASKGLFSTQSLAKVDITLSGASSLSLNGKLESLQADLAGASTLVGGVSGGKLSIHLSGASNAALGKFGAVTKDISGASSLKVN